MTKRIEKGTPAVEEDEECAAGDGVDRAQGLEVRSVRVVRSVAV